MNPTGLLDRAAPILRALKIEEIQYSLNGGGDSGEVELDHVLQSDGSEHNVLPAIPVVIDNRGKPT